MTRMKAMVCRYSRPAGTSTYVCTSHVTSVASTMTKATAADMPSDVSIFLETPRKGQMPRNCANTMLLTKMALMKIRIYSIIVVYYVISL